MTILHVHFSLLPPPLSNLTTTMSNKENLPASSKRQACVPTQQQWTRHSPFSKSWHWWCKSSETAMPFNTVPIGNLWVIKIHAPALWSITTKPFTHPTLPKAKLLLAMPSRQRGSIKWVGEGWSPHSSWFLYFFHSQLQCKHPNYWMPPPPCTNAQRELDANKMYEWVGKPSLLLFAFMSYNSYNSSSDSSADESIHSWRETQSTFGNGQPPMDMHHPQSKTRKNPSIHRLRHHPPLMDSPNLKESHQWRHVIHRMKRKNNWSIHGGRPLVKWPNI